MVNCVSQTEVSTSCIYIQYQTEKECTELHLYPRSVDSLTRTLSAYNTWLSKQELNNKFNKYIITHQTS